MPEIKKGKMIIKLRKVYLLNFLLVHTLGYGDRLNKLRSRVNCTQQVSDGEKLISDLLKYCQVPNGKLERLLSVFALSVF
jgi:hypothetical protein